MLRPSSCITVLFVLALALSACGSAATESEPETSPSAVAGAEQADPSPASSLPSEAASDGPASAPSAPPATGTGTAQVASSDSATYGSLLVDGDGTTLYVFLSDELGQSTCFDACADSWPPLLTEGAAAADGDADEQLLGTADRGDGTTQVTYDGRPLYHYSGDTLPGDVLGYASGDVWYPVNPDGSVIDDATEPDNDDSGANY